MRLGYVAVIRVAVASKPFGTPDSRRVVIKVAARQRPRRPTK